MKVLGAENKNPSIFGEITEYSRALMDFCWWKKSIWKKCGCSCTHSRTPQNMDRTLTLIFAKSNTIWGIIIRISAFSKLRLIRIHTNYGECFLMESVFKNRVFLYKVGFHRGQQLMKFWEIQNWKFLFIQIPSTT